LLFAGAFALALPHAMAGEGLAPVEAQVCPAISGFVYYDIDDDGILEPGEPGIPGVPMQLRNPAGATVALATTDGSGAYRFDRDNSGSAPVQTERRSISFAETLTDWIETGQVARFDPAKGTLDSVELILRAAITSTIKAESLDTGPQEINAEVGGTISIHAPGRDLSAAPVANAGTFQATAYDGVTDFGGSSGTDFGSATATGAASALIADTAALDPWSGDGGVAVSASASASSRTSGSGNVLTEIHTVASAELEVVYRYLPVNCLAAGSYTIVEVSQPGGYGDGLETAGNQSPIPGSRGPDVISVTLAGEGLEQNNFGELASALQGCVYLDGNENGHRDGGEAGIAGVLIALSGTAGSTATTDGDGCYLFSNLPPGGYEIRETQPPGYRDCEETVGSQGGLAGNDRIYEIRLGASVFGAGNDFGECVAPTATPTATAGLSPSPTQTSTAAATPTPPATVVTTTATPTSTSAGGVVSSGAPTPPAAPGAGSGLFGLEPDVRVVIIGFAIFAASGWLAFLALGRARDQREQ
jgi:hypothetical protein